MADTSDIQNLLDFIRLDGLGYYEFDNQNGARRPPPLLPDPDRPIVAQPAAPVGHSAHTITEETIVTERVVQPAPPQSAPKLVDAPQRMPMPAAQKPTITETATMPPAAAATPAPNQPPAASAPTPVPSAPPAWAAALGAKPAYGSMDNRGYGAVSAGAAISGALGAAAQAASRAAEAVKAKAGAGSSDQADSAERADNEASAVAESLAAKVDPAEINLTPPSTTPPAPVSPAARPPIPAPDSAAADARAQAQAELAAAAAARLQDRSPQKAAPAPQSQPKAETNDDSSLADLFKRL